MLICCQRLQSFEQLNFISSDCSPSTGLPYTPQHIIERAFWQSAQLRAKIPAAPTPSASYSHALHATGTSLDRRPSSPPPALPSQADDRTDLGLTTHINSTLNPDQLDSHHQQRYFLVPADDTARLNDGPLPGELPQAGPNGAPVKAKASSLPGGPEGFFGLALETRWGARGGVFGTTEEERLGRRFVGFEPCRVAVEFWNVGDLRDKQRLYSRTWHFQGSAYNLYLQKVVKKAQNQLGIYLHRQNPHEPFPVASQPPGGLGVGVGVAPVGQEGAGVGHATFVDGRTKIQAFFSIWCPNQLGKRASIVWRAWWTWRLTSHGPSFRQARR